MSEILMPIEVYWDPESKSLRPTGPRWTRQCEKQFSAGEVYKLQPEPAHASAARKAFFASVGNAFKNLPERFDEQFATPDDLRYYALIRTGWADSNEIAASTPAGAQKLAAWARPREKNGIVEIDGNVVRISYARSQAQNHMNQADFEASSRAVLDYIAKMIGVHPSALPREGH